MRRLSSRMMRLILIADFRLNTYSLFAMFVCLSWIDMSSLWPASQRPGNTNVLNGIALGNDHVLLTGKRWDRMYKIDFPDWPSLFYDGGQEENNVVDEPASILETLGQTVDIAATRSPSNQPTGKPISDRPSVQPTNMIRTDPPLALWLPQTTLPLTEIPSNQPTGKPVSDSPSPRPTKNSSTNSPSTLRSPPTTISPTLITFDGQSGAIVTRDCLFENDYPYAIDIYWSCGDERFDNPLRLHTFKRHSRGHQKIFADQLMTYENGMLWFEEYSTNRCVFVNDGGDIRLSSTASRCDGFILISQETNVGTDGKLFYIRQVSTGECITMGDGTDCNDNRSTGGDECGGVDHRFLPLKMGLCNRALSFQFETMAEDCTNGQSEYPGSLCF